MWKKSTNEIKSTAHSKCRCQYHIVFAAKYRRKEIYGQLKKDIGEILRKLCEQKGVEIIEAEACVDHIHMLVSIPPHISISQFMGFLKGKSSLMIFWQACEFEIQRWVKELLAQRILRRDSREKQKGNSRVYTKSVRRRLFLRPNKYERIYGPVYG